MAEPQLPHLRARWLHRLAWLVLLWLGGVVSLGLVAGTLRLVMAWVGLQR